MTEEKRELFIKIGDLEIYRVKQDNVCDEAIRCSELRTIVDGKELSDNVINISINMPSDGILSYTMDLLPNLKEKKGEKQND